MNAKHYVSLEVAKMLKEKGYDEETETIYNIIGELERVESMFRRKCAANTMLMKYGYISAPTLLEAMDWLEDRRIRIELQYSDYYHLWYSTIKLPIVTITGMGYYADRNECMNETIKKGLELL